MEDRNLPSALCDSITEEAGNAVAGILEVGLDSIFEDGLLKDVPLLSTAASLYKIGHSVKERHYIKKLAKFIQALNDGLAGDAQVKVFRDRILNHGRVHSPPLGAYKLTPNEVRLGRIPRSCEAGGKCQMAFECLHRGSLLIRKKRKKNWNIF